jgi:hypothetical protein
MAKARRFDDFDDEDDRPSHRRREDEYDEDDRPSRRRRDDDEEFDDRPRRRGRPKKKSNTALILLLVLGGVFLLCCGGGIGLYLIFGGAASMRGEVTADTFRKVRNGSTLAEVEAAIGKGKKLSPQEAASTQVTTSDGKKTSLTTAGGLGVAEWYQWGSGPRRLFVGIGPGPGGRPVVTYKLVDIDDGVTQFRANASGAFDIPLPGF